MRRIIGDLPSGLPYLQIGGLFSNNPGVYLPILEFALDLAVLGSIGSLLTSGIVDNITKTKPNNRELIGQGIDNMNDLVLITGLHPQPFDMRQSIDIIPDLLPKPKVFAIFRKDFNG